MRRGTGSTQRLGAKNMWALASIESVDLCCLTNTHLIVANSSMKAQKISVGDFEKSPTELQPACNYQKLISSCRCRQCAQNSGNGRSCEKDSNNDFPHHRATALPHAIYTNGEENKQPYTNPQRFFIPRCAVSHRCSPHKLIWNSFHIHLNKMCHFCQVIYLQ